MNASQSNCTPFAFRHNRKKSQGEAKEGLADVINIHNQLTNQIN